MRTTAFMLVKDLSLDLNNFRTVPQKNEIDALNAIISIKPDKFWALMESIIDDGFLPIENIIIVKNADNQHIVKEGNRRIGILKILLNVLDKGKFNIPRHIEEKITLIDKDWIDSNSNVQCTIYDMEDIEAVDKIVSITHGKGENAARDPWTSIARARHNRDMAGSSEPALDLLEKYFKIGKNITQQQKERWSGDYPITILDEGIKVLYPRLELSSKKEIAEKYPEIKFRSELEEIIKAIGDKIIGFPEIRRETTDIFTDYGIPPLAIETVQAPVPVTSQPTVAPDTPTSTSTATPTSAPTPTTKPTSNPGQTSTPPPKPKNHPITDKKTVRAKLRAFNPKGNDRQKVASLRGEAILLDIEKTPISFCFLLRSMFEISAKAYCKDHGIPVKKAIEKDGVKRLTDKTLLELLKDVKAHLVANNKNTDVTKLLHGAITELGRKDGLLSVTSMNQLVHSETFSIAPKDICTLFGNIYPLLEMMN
jgi:hypothetical protein